ncbi:hypothetical protein B0A69_00265 [Chryseobacterium shigense]|uniref:Uncharacterized protein n=1 Tax=Chryseobacterium shigense TaxID=297244 RepID=A0A1N7I068_9FLAO|nr:hypothetical protein [Chryseobacterium shigense]PQA97807.1 hypothetical protein B0A69_00265 [Chryseobacterium shigense]SIS30469.1 hypothetical protein SAMN05421639_101922 [Chryseobacterium shigense]
MVPDILKNLDQKTYRLETIVTEQKNPFYLTEKKYVRHAEVYHLGNEKDYFKYHVLVVDFIFSDDDNAVGKFLKQISYLFDELELTVDQEGNIVEVNNINFLRLRWMKIAARLSETHKGEVIDTYFSQISSILEDESRLIDFLGGYPMFGLLFNGLLQSFDTRRKRESPDGFTEMMTPVKEGEKITLTITPENLEPTEIDHFRGLFVFKGDHYEEGFIEIKKNNTHLKHSLLWIG